MASKEHGDREAAAVDAIGFEPTVILILHDDVNRYLRLFKRSCHFVCAVDRRQALVKSGRDLGKGSLVCYAQRS
jgi:hypothetical protein